MAKDFVRRGIRSRLFLVGLMVIIPVLVIAVFVSYQRFQQEKARELQANLEIARAVAQTFDAFVKDVMHTELAVGMAAIASPPPSKDSLRKIMQTAEAINPILRSFTWISPEGIHLVSTNRKIEGRPVAKTSWPELSRLLSGEDWAITPVYVSPVTGERVFTISRGFRDEKGHVSLGVVSCTAIADKMDSFLGFKRAKDAGVSLLDSKGIHVYRYPATKYTEEQGNWLKFYPEMKDALHGKEVATTVSSESSGKNRLVAFVPAPFTGWVASASRAEDEVIASIISTLLPQVLLILLVGVGAFVMVLVLSRPISIGILHLRGQAFAVEEGANGPELVSGPGELKDLSQVLSHMSQQVRSREAALRQSEQRWATTLASIGDAVIAADLEGRVTFMNKVAEELTGWTLSEASTKPVADVFHIINEHTRNGVEDPVAKVLKEGVIVGLANHTVLVGRGGKEIPIDDSGAPIRDQDGSLTGVVLVFRDITERKRAEEQLQRTNQRINEILASIQDDFYVLDRDWNFVYASRQFASRIGREPKDFMGKNIWKMFPKHLGTVLEEKFRAAMDKREIRRFEVSGKYTNKWYAMTAFPCTEGITVLGTDITDRRRAEETLRENEARLRRFYESGLLGVIYWNMNAEITDANDKFLEMLGYTREDLATGHLDWAHMTPPEYRKRDEESMAELRATGTNKVPFEKEYIRKDGTRIPIIVAGAMLDEARFNGVAFVLDVTDRKRAVQALEESEARYRSLFEHMLDGFAYCQMLFDEQGRPEDFVYLAVNDAFGRLTGLEDVIGKRVTQVIPQIKELTPELFEIYGRVSLTGEPERFEIDFKPLGLYFSISVYSPARGYFMAVFDDITQSRRAEEALRQRTFELEHLSETLEHRVKERTAELADVSSQLVSAQENERKRVSYDLHDNVWQTLVAIRYEVQRLFSGEGGKEWAVLENKSKKVMATLLDAVGKIRATQGDLWPYVLDDIGILATVDWYCREFEQTHPGLMIERKNDLVEEEIPSNAKIVVYRILQQALSNVARHSQASQVTLALSKNDHGFEFAVRDNGIGFDPEGTMRRKTPWGGLGLLTMKARTELSGGLFRVESAAGDGTAVYARWPIPEDNSILIIGKKSSC